MSRSDRPVGQYLPVSSEVRVKFLEKDYKYYLNKSVILFGASNSGKSTILIEILYLLKDHVPIVFVFAPTADANNAFEGIIPGIVVYMTVHIPLLVEIYKRQQAAKKIFNVVNNLKSLRILFEKIADTNLVETAKSAYRNANEIILKKKNDEQLNFIEKKTAIKEIKNVRDEYLMKLYKHYIRLNKRRLKKMNLTDSERYIIKYLDFNPYLTIIFDDCGSVLKKFQKEEIVKTIFEQGRHNFISIILTLQDDANLDSSLKKNAFINIFTTSRCASAYFERGSNSFSKKEKIKAAKIIGGIFTESKKKHYKKLVYLREHMDPFRYTVADIYDTFRFGSPSLWSLDSRIVSEKRICDFDNDPLLSDFKIDI